MNAWLARAVCLALCFGIGTQEKIVASAMGEGAAAVSISPASLDFGTAAVSSTNPPKTITISNPASVPLSVSVLISGIDFSQSNDCGESLAAGAKCTVQVSFAPAITGSRVGTLNISDSSATPPHIVVLNGVGK